MIIDPDNNCEYLKFFLKFQDTKFFLFDYMFKDNLIKVFLNIKKEANDKI